MASPVDDEDYVDDDGGAAAVAVQKQNAAVVAGVLSCLQELRDEAEKFLDPDLTRTIVMPSGRIGLTGNRAAGGENREI